MYPARHIDKKQKLLFLEIHDLLLNPQLYDGDDAKSELDLA